MMVRVRLGLGYCLVAVIFNLAIERMGQISAGLQIFVKIVGPK